METDGKAYDPPTWRDQLEFHLHLEELRATIRHTMAERRWSYERAAAEIGTTAHRVRELLDGRAYLAAEDLEPFDVWCGDTTPVHVYAEQAALSLLCQDYLPRSRSLMRQRLVLRLQRAYQLQRIRVPMWIYQELEAWKQVRPRSYLGRRRA